MVDKNALLELYNPGTGETKDVTSIRFDDKLYTVRPTVGIGWSNYHPDGTAYMDQNKWRLRNKVDVNLVDQINNAGWMIANLGQDDNQLWHYEIREGYLTSYKMVLHGKGFAFMDEALAAAFKKIADFNKLKGLAKDLGITGKVSF